MAAKELQDDVVVLYNRQISVSQRESFQFFVGDIDNDILLIGQHDDGSVVEHDLVEVNRVLLGLPLELVLLVHPLLLVGNADNNVFAGRTVLGTPDMASKVVTATRTLSHGHLSEGASFEHDDFSSGEDRVKNVGS